MKKNIYKRPFVRICNINTDFLLAGSNKLRSGGDDSILNLGEEGAVGDSKNAIFSDDGGNSSIW